MSRQAFVDSIRFALTESEAEAVEIARRRGVRFVVTTPLRPDLYSSYCTLLGLSPSRYIGSNPNSGEMFSLKLNSYKLVGPHLHETDGRAILGAEGGNSVLAGRLEHFRLVYEAPAGSPEFTGANRIP